MSAFDDHHRDGDAVKNGEKESKLRIALLMPPSEEEWTVVTTCQDKRRVIRSRNRRPPLNAASTFPSKHVASWMDETRYAIVKTISECRQGLSSTSFFQSLKRSILEKFEIHQIVCYGIGNLSTSPTSPMWQLACALELRKALEQGTDDKNEIPFFFYDPCTTESEADLMTNEWSVQVLSENERGKRGVNGLATLFFMPHCPLLLYGNVMWANWKKDLNRVVLFGNSLPLYQERAIDKNNIPEAVSLLLPFVKEEQVVVSKSDEDNTNGDLESAFNDCFLTWLAVDDDALLPLRPSEVISQDDEVI